MRPPLHPAGEAQRLDALRQYRLLDTLPEQSLDDLTSLAAGICGTPISLVSLVDENRQWFKSNHGMPMGETARDISFCGHAILEPDLFVVPDATLDERFSDSPLVTGELHIRFYAGAPLSTPDGLALGTLCVMDRVPRDLSAEQRQALRVLSRQVMAQLQLGRRAQELAESEARLLQVFRTCPVALAIHRWSDRRFVDINPAFTRLLGWAREDVVGHTTLGLGIIDTATGDRLHTQLEGTRELRDTEITVTTRDGERRHVLVGAELVDLYQEAHAVTTFVDITHRKEAELARNRLAAIVESSDDAVIGKDLKGVIRSWNTGAERIFGYSSAEMVGESIMRLIPADRQHEETHILAEIAAGKSVTHFETRRQTKDGRLIDVSVTSSPIKDSTGQIVGASKVARDTSERHRAEEARRASDARYRALFDYAPDGILIADSASRYLDANPSICRMLGYSREELVGLSAADIVADSDVIEIAPAIDAIRSTTDYHRQWRFKRRDGSIFAADVIATVMPDGRLLGMVRDVTERDQAIDAVRRAEERMRFALDSAQVGVWDMDYTTGELRWSEILEAQYGLAPGTFGGTLEAFLDRVHPDDVDALVGSMRAAMASGEDFTVQHRARWADGTVRWITGSGRILLNERGEPVRGVGMSMDVTDRRTLEEQFRQAQKMEAIGRLAGGVAHDFNNLLTVILGYSQLLLDELEGDDRRRADVSEIRNAAASAAGLTRQLLAFSRKQIIEPTLLDLNAVVTDMREMLGRLIGEDVKVVLGLADELALVKADRGQVEQIVMNLAVNARDAMPNGGTLTIETANVELDEHYAKTHLAVEPGPYVVAHGDRHRNRHDAGGAGAPVRAVLHDQGTRQGHGARPRDRARHRDAERRERERLQRDRQGHVVQGLFSEGNGGRRRGGAACRGAPRTWERIRCSWSRIRTNFARSR